MCRHCDESTPRWIPAIVVASLVVVGGLITKFLSGYLLSVRSFGDRLRKRLAPFYPHADSLLFVTLSFYQIIVSCHYPPLKRIVLGRPLLCDAPSSPYLASPTRPPLPSSMQRPACNLLFRPPGQISSERLFLSVCHRCCCRRRTTSRSRDPPRVSSRRSASSISTFLFCRSVGREVGQDAHAASCT